MEVIRYNTRPQQRNPKSNTQRTKRVTLRTITLKVRYKGTKAATDAGGAAQSSGNRESSKKAATDAEEAAPRSNRTKPVAITRKVR